MADGDIIHPKLPLRYQGIYKRICEGVVDEESLARQALKCLKKDKEDHGEAPLQLIQQEALLFEQFEACLSNDIPLDWSEARRAVKELARALSGSQRGLGLAIRACEQQLDLLQKHQHQEVRPGQYALEITRQYLLNIYDERFAKRVPDTQEAYQGAHPVFVEERMSAMRPFVLRGIALFAHEIVENKALRLPPRQTALRKIDLEKDLDRDLLELL